MKNLLCIVILALLFGGACSSTALARTVYFKDGSVIENAKSAWQSKGTVHVLVNRDTYLTFQSGEVDLKRSFGRHNHTHPHKVTKGRKVHAATLPPAQHKEDHSPAAKAAARAEKNAATENNAASEKKAAAPAPQPVKGKAAAPAAVKAKAPATNTATPAATETAVAKDDAAAAMDKTFSEAMKKSGLPVPNEEQARQLRENKSVAMTPEQMQAATNAMGAKTAEALIRGGVFWKLPLLLLKSTMGQVTLLLMLIMLASFWKVFAKAGHAGWKSLIPIYNMIVLLQIAGKPIWWALLFLIPIVNLIFLILMHMEIAKRFSKHPAFGVGLTFLPLVFFGILAFDKSSYGTATGDDGFTFE